MQFHTKLGRNPRSNTQIRIIRAIPRRAIVARLHGILCCRRQHHLAVGRCPFVLLVVVHRPQHGEQLNFSRGQHHRRACCTGSRRRGQCRRVGVTAGVGRAAAAARARCERGPAAHGIGCRRRGVAVHARVAQIEADCGHVGLTSWAWSRRLHLIRHPRMRPSARGRSRSRHHRVVGGGHEYVRSVASHKMVDVARGCDSLVLGGGTQLVRGVILRDVGCNHALGALKQLAMDMAMGCREGGTTTRPVDGHVRWRDPIWRCCTQCFAWRGVRL